MIVKKEDVIQAVEILGEASPVGKVLSALLEETKEDVLDLRDIQACFSYQMWTEEDAAKAISDYANSLDGKERYEATEENIQAVISLLDLEGFADCNAQQCLLASAVDQARKRGLLQPTTFRKSLKNTCSFKEIWKEDEIYPVSEMDISVAIITEASGQKLFSRLIPNWYPLFW